ncbi:hypothetical protein [Acinetobacter bereziniae]|uniref:hypothetical protein n=1 Tax=Acinetobacter bereziniae TaxID=106648 RepID=UPI003571353B
MHLKKTTYIQRITLKKMKIIESKVKNLRIQKTKYEVLKNNGKQATVSAALGVAVGSAALVSQAVLLMNASIDVESLTFTLNGEEFEGIFNEILNLSKVNVELCS